MKAATIIHLALGLLIISLLSLPPPSLAQDSDNLEPECVHPGFHSVFPFLCGVFRPSPDEEPSSDRNEPSGSGRAAPRT